MRFLRNIEGKRRSKRMRKQLREFKDKYIEGSGLDSAVGIVTGYRLDGRGVGV
jgi:hypothetical protein